MRPVQASRGPLNSTLVLAQPRKSVWNVRPRWQRLWLPLCLALLPTAPATFAQGSGSLATEFYGNGVEISVIVHDGSGEPISSAAMVKLFRGGTIPSGQAETNRGRAELVVNSLGDFTVVVSAPGYPTTQKEISIGANGRTQLDVYLSRSSSGSAGTGVPGRPLLAPKAKKTVDEAVRALAGDNVGKAEKLADEAMRLAPGHPDVLYLRGVVYLKQREWTKAQEVLERATQIDPAYSQAFAALGMALWDEEKPGAAIAPLERALQLNPAVGWDTRLTLAKAYYQHEQYDQALQMSQEALAASNRKAPEIQLLVAQSLTAVGRYEDAAQTLREFLRDHSERHEAATARRWLDGLAANGKIR